jgi:hypothetical protein
MRSKEELEKIVIIIGLITICSIIINIYQAIPKQQNNETIETVETEITENSFTTGIRDVLPHGNNYCILIAKDRWGSFEVAYVHTPTGEIDETTDLYMYRNIPFEIFNFLLDKNAIAYTYISEK